MADTSTAQRLAEQAKRTQEVLGELLKTAKEAQNSNGKRPTV